MQADVNPAATAAGVGLAGIFVEHVAGLLDQLAQLVRPMSGIKIAIAGLGIGPAHRAFQQH
ncbi:hypothetical protein D3C87_1894760 [compost metagenome]